MRRSAVGHGLWRCHSQPIKGRCHGCTALRRRSTRSPLPSPPLHTTPVQVAITVMTALPPPDPNRKTPAPSSRRRPQRSSTDPSQPAQLGMKGKMIPLMTVWLKDVSTWGDHSSIWHQAHHC
ncbi:hypothetical protein PVAP13_2NG274200 [Panicum virgatum]|uniref:Uncharacterized protein n=1 Tax=Panicum virgatum TaxID=38727 RepID=A0A8T0VIN2_PANVG|nr:hypothetical protein PVAP13_2NG274200 [Panicum virgatum]KAG2633183.1 hypothetical protein PVAP13_2NG274200 [Panicum virgatum]KAG2633184.1 hypothetical protein PVAP13_2NG274200 [Panicum virgatum]KAG2633185.1 hypothetical protein PVAP13_2NG274200 [Panicum virgatum]KAG2633186.1 hypothetical protein PVAP13_2NG274200 [Panicum virgatum]